MHRWQLKKKSNRIKILKKVYDNINSLTNESEPADNPKKMSLNIWVYKTKYKKCLYKVWRFEGYNEKSKYTTTSGWIYKRALNLNGLTKIIYKSRKWTLKVN